MDDETPEKGKKAGLEQRFGVRQNGARLAWRSLLPVICFGRHYLTRFSSLSFMMIPMLLHNPSRIT